MAVHRAQLLLQDVAHLGSCQGGSILEENPQNIEIHLRHDATAATSGHLAEFDVKTLHLLADGQGSWRVAHMELVVGRTSSVLTCFARLPLDFFVMQQDRQHLPYEHDGTADALCNTAQCGTASTTDA